MNSMKLAIYGTLLTLLVSCGSTGKAPKKSNEEKKADIYYSYGTQNLIDKNYKEALKNLLKAHEYQPSDDRILNNLGMAYFLRGDNQNAIHFLKKAINENEENIDAKINIASIYFNLRKYDEALDLYVQITKNLTYDKQFRTYYNMALVYEKKGMRSKVREYLKLSVKEKKDYCPSNFKLGLMSYQEKQYDKAMTHIRDAQLGTCYEDPAPHYYEALILKKKKKFHQALTKFEYVMENFSRTKFFTMADLHRKKLRKLSPISGDIEQARIEFEKIKSQPTKTREFKGANF